MQTNIKQYIDKKAQSNQSRFLKNEAQKLKLRDLEQYNAFDTINSQQIKNKKQPLEYKIQLGVVKDHQQERESKLQIQIQDMNSKLRPIKKLDKSNSGQLMRSSSQLENINIIHIQNSAQQSKNPSPSNKTSKKIKNSSSKATQPQVDLGFSSAPSGKKNMHQGSQNDTKKLPQIAHSRLSNPQPRNDIEQLIRQKRPLASSKTINVKDERAGEAQIQIFEGMNAVKQQRYDVKQKVSLQESHQINLSLGRLQKTRLKQAIQKQIVEFAHRQSGIQQLQDMYQKRQLAGVAKQKQMDLKDQIDQQNKRMQMEQVMIRQQEYQSTMLEVNNQDKSKRIDFIQQLINKSNQKQQNSIKFDQNFQIDRQNQHLQTQTYEDYNKEIQIPMDQLIQAQKQTLNININQLQGMDQYYQNAAQLANGVRSKRNSTQLENLGSKNLALPQVGNDQTPFRMVNHQNNGRQSTTSNRNAQIFSPQPLGNKSIFTEIEQVADFQNYQQNQLEQRYNHNYQNLQQQNNSALSMMQQMRSWTLSKDKSSQRMSKIVEGLAQKDVELQDAQEYRYRQQGEQSDKKHKRSQDRYIDINIQTNLKTYNSDSEHLGISGKSKQFQANSHQMGHMIQMGAKLRLQGADKDFLKLKSIQNQLSPKSYERNSNQYHNFVGINYPRGGALGVQGDSLNTLPLNDPRRQSKQNKPLDILKTIEIRENTLKQTMVHGKFYYNKSQISGLPNVIISTQQEKEKQDQDLNEYRQLFAKLGLNFDLDVPPSIKEQLKVDKNAKQVLQDLGKELEDNGDIATLKKYLEGPRKASPEEPPPTQSPIKTKKMGGDPKTEQKRKPKVPPAPKVINENLNTDSANLHPNACFAVKPGQATTIKILNEPLKNHINHPINKFLKLTNDFCYLTLFKAANFRGSSQKVPNFDVQLIQIISKQLKIDVPKNQNGNDLQQLFKSKQFIVTCKAQILQKLWSLINKENDVELNFERSQFQFYKGFIGRGNNAPLLVQLFKQHRWWWSIYQSFAYDEEGNPVIPYSAQQAMNNQNFNNMLYKESFVEHNFLWTQWKKLKHFQYLKTPSPEELKKMSITKQDRENVDSDIPEDEEAQKQGPNLSNSLKVYAKLENNYHLSNKALDRDPFEVLPVTFHIKKGSSDPEYQKFLTMFKGIDQQRSQTLKDEKELLTKMEMYEADIADITSKLQKVMNTMSQQQSQNNSIEILEDATGEDKSKESTDDKRDITVTSKESFLPDLSEQKSDLIIDEKLLRRLHVQKKQNVMELERLKRTKTRVSNLISESKAKLEHLQKAKQVKNIWILKPGENTNRGVGITVQTSIKDIGQIINSEASNPQRTFILQKYIESPALYKQRKFDIRCFGMVCSINGHLKGFNYDDGYLRTSGREYNTKTTNKFIHLTNDAVQKRSEDYGRFEFGNKVSYQEYQQYLNQTVPHLNIDFRQHILSQIKRIMTDTIRACYKIIDPHKRQHSFEILGYDFMLDDNFKVYLIEVNTNPCLETTCPILHKIITDVVDSGLRIALDPLFPPPNFTKRMSMQIPLTMWELCYDSRLDYEEIEKVMNDYDKRQNEATQGPIKSDQPAEKEQEDDFDEDLIKEEEEDVYDD